MKNVLKKLVEYLGRSSDDNMLFKNTLILLQGYYQKMSDAIMVHDFTLDAKNHRIEFSKTDKNYLYMIDLNEESIAIRFEREFLFFLSDSNYEIQITRFLDSFFNGKYYIERKKYSKSIILSGDVVWLSDELKYLNKIRKPSFLNFFCLKKEQKSHVSKINLGQRNGYSKPAY